MKRGWPSIVLKALVLALGGFARWSPAQDISVLHLQPPAQAPFKQGDSLDIWPVPAPPDQHMHVRILDLEQWPWVFVRCGNLELWINFQRVAYAARSDTGWD